MSSQQLKDNLVSFRLGETDNCLVVATALRHAVAHGFMSVHPKGTSSQTARRFCVTLRAMLLSISDSEFSLLFESLQN